MLKYTGKTGIHLERFGLTRQAFTEAICRYLSEDQLWIWFAALLRWVLTISGKGAAVGNLCGAKNSYCSVRSGSYVLRAKRREDVDH